MTELGVNAVMKKHGYVFAVRGHEVQPTGVRFFSGNAVATTYGSTDHSNNVSFLPKTQRCSIGYDQ